MKKIFALSLAMVLTVPALAMGAPKVVTSEKMLDDYDRYAVVYSSDEERIYVDTETLERDPVSAGELPVIRATLYAEIYKDPLTYPDFGNNNLVACIQQYDTAVGADQYGQKIKYRILNKLQATYTPDGKPTTYFGQNDDPVDEADDIYVALYRLSKTY